MERVGREFEPMVAHEREEPSWFWCSRVRSTASARDSSMFAFGIRRGALGEACGSRFSEAGASQGIDHDIAAEASRFRTHTPRTFPSLHGSQLDPTDCPRKALSEALLSP